MTEIIVLISLIVLLIYVRKQLKKKYPKQLNKFHDFYFGIERKPDTKKEEK